MTGDKNGVECKCTAARDELIQEHIGWARQIAARVARVLPTWFRPDDLAGPVEIALLRLAEDYDSTRGIPFRAYAQRRIYGACFDSVRRKEYRERSHRSIDAMKIGGQSSHRVERAFIDPGASPERLAELEEMKGIWAHVDKLPENHRLVIQWRYAEDATNVQVAAWLGLSESRVSQMHSEALVLLRQMMGEAGE